MEDLQKDTLWHVTAKDRCQLLPRTTFITRSFLRPIIVELEPGGRTAAASRSDATRLSRTPILMQDWLLGPVYMIFSWGNNLWEILDGLSPKMKRYYKLRGYEFTGKTGSRHGNFPHTFADYLVHLGGEPNDNCRLSREERFLRMQHRHHSDVDANGIETPEVEDGNHASVLSSDGLDIKVFDAEENRHQPITNDPTLYPDGGLRAWSVVGASFLMVFCTFGLSNGFGIFQTYLSQHQLSNHKQSDIAWIGSVQIFLSFFGGLLSGRLNNFWLLLKSGYAIHMDRGG